MVQALAVAHTLTTLPHSRTQQLLASRNETFYLANCRCHALIVRGHPLAIVPIAHDVVV